MRRSPREFRFAYGGRTSDTTLLFQELAYAMAPFARVVPSGTKFCTGIETEPRIPLRWRAF